jgi:PKD repeat protein
MKRTLFLSAALLAAALVAVGLPGAAVAAPPANDDFANATTIDPSSLPFTDTVSVVEAGYEAGEIGYCGVSNTAWYSFTPTQDEVVRADPSGSSFYGAAMNAYRQDGSGLGGLSQLACSTYGGQLTFSVQAGYTYYLQAGSSYYGAGDLRLAFDVVPPPTNDDFANAKPIGSLPSSDSVDATAATVEAGEPTPACGYGQSPGTVWYAFIPSVTGSYMATSSAYYFSTQVAVYTGGGLGSLSQIGCRSNGQALTFHADAGTTYYLQTGGLFGGRGTINLNFFVAPNPVANFGFYPGDPSGFDTLQFYDESYDPGGNSFTSETWDFGDGGTASSPGCCPTHKYLADGDYKVKLTVTTTDGRTASTTQTIKVRTHDVAIAKLSVPQSGSVGQTRSITVGISNKRYGETVQVQLFKSGPNGFEFVGTLQQSVPVRSGGRTTDFKFSYTFTSTDASLGKVTFKAVASLIGARDALPADNEAVALPTKVS